VYNDAELRMNRLRSLVSIPDGAKLLDIGAAQGEYVAAYQKLGLRVVGVEPWDEARKTASRLSEHLSVPIDIRKGRAEELPFDDNSFDIVLATSVLEHVENLESSISEIYRILRPGGLFWFNSASSLCPLTSEITGFPFFGWYPNRLKLKIMNWAKVNKPELIGYTEHPAIHWFTPWKARRILKKHGFRKVYDRWDVSRTSTRRGIKSIVFRIITMGSATKFLADVLRRGCNYTAIK
ncbi:MAG: class I SAM-dependent methyltransferase, partial [Bacteroidales bacterium]|nr:class I SAM-dependent methyltransferase [Candidatus Latescibacterota bacterium]